MKLHPQAVVIDYPEQEGAYLLFRERAFQLRANIQRDHPRLGLSEAASSNLIKVGALCVEESRTSTEQIAEAKRFRAMSDAPKIGQSAPHYPALRAVIPGTESRLLDRSETPVVANVLDLFRRRRSCRAFEQCHIPAVGLESVLSHALSLDNYNQHARPYGSPGGTYSVESFVFYYRVNDRPEGLYYIDALHNTIHGPITVHPTLATTLMLWACDALRGASKNVERVAPHALVLLFSNFAEIVRRYGYTGVSLLQKEVGGITQQLHLSATAFGLSGCGIGGTCSYNFDSISWLVESGLIHVGSFAIGAETQEGV